MSLDEIINEESQINNQKWRVKLYELNHKGQWYDNGNGYVYAIETPSPTLVMELVDSSQDIINYAINENVEFHLQRKTILTWRKRQYEENTDRDGSDGDEEDDIGISFQDKEGTNVVWKFLCHYTGREMIDDDQSESDTIIDSLYDVSRSNLPFIAREIRQDLDDADKRDLLSFIKNNDCDFIKKLGVLLIEEEKELESTGSFSIGSATTISLDSCDSLSIDDDDEDDEEEECYKEKICARTRKVIGKSSQEPKATQENLSFIYSIMKNILLLADSDLIESLLSNELYLTTFGALEYDFEHKGMTMYRHRYYFTNEVKFHNIMNIKSKDLLYQIHLNQRLIYLKDTAMSNAMTMTMTINGNQIKETLMKTLTAMIQIGNGEIVDFFIKHKDHLSQLISKCTMNNKSGLKRDENEIKDIARFLLELMNCSKETMHYNTFYTLLCEMNLLNTIEHILSNYDNGELTKVLMLVFNNIMAYSSKIVIDYLASSPSVQLLLLLCSHALKQDTQGIKDDISHIILSIFQTSSVLPTNLQEPMQNTLKNTVQHMVNLIQLPNEIIPQQSKVVLLNTLCLCLVTPFAYANMRKWLRTEDIEEKILSIKHNEKANGKNMILYLIKFLKCLLSNEYEAQMSLDTIDWIMLLFKQNVKKSNVIMSSVIELFEVVIKGKSSDEMLKRIFAIGSDFFYNEGHKKYFKKLIERYELIEAENDDEMTIYCNEETESQCYMNDIDVNEKEEAYTEAGNVFQEKEEDDDVIPIKREIDFFRNKEEEFEEDQQFLGKKTHASENIEDIFKYCALKE